MPISNVRIISFRPTVCLSLYGYGFLRRW